MEPIKRYSIRDELKRTYLIYDRNNMLVHRLELKAPVDLFWGKGHAFHRISISSGKVVLVNAPGPIILDGEIVGYCVLEWSTSKSKNPCRF